MKRIHLFEFEDFSWFPHWLRLRLTRLINVMHDILNTEEDIAKHLKPIIEETNTTQIIDFCSGSGGPMPGVLNKLVYRHEIDKLSLTLTDLYPDMETAKKFQSVKNISYYTRPVNAAEKNPNLKGLKTMICSFHHLKPDAAKLVLAQAEKDNKAIFIYEISDNSTPKYLWWIALPINFIMCLFITPKVESLKLSQLFFTYIIPIIPFLFAWDGAVSNARTYNLKDLDILLEGLGSKNYTWTKGVTDGKMKKVFLYGKPV